jgi:hypothetical protein
MMQFIQSDPNLNSKLSAFAIKHIKLILLQRYDIKPRFKKPLPYKSVEKLFKEFTEKEIIEKKLSSGNMGFIEYLDKIFNTKRIYTNDYYISLLEPIIENMSLYPDQAYNIGSVIAKYLKDKKNRGERVLKLLKIDESNIVHLDIQYFALKLQPSLLDEFIKSKELIKQSNLPSKSTKTMFIKPSKTYFFQAHLFNKYGKYLDKERRETLSAIITKAILSDVFDDPAKKKYIISLSKLQVGDNSKEYDTIIEELKQKFNDKAISK